MTENPAWIVLMVIAGAFLFHLWWSDLRAAKSGTPNPRALPGATPCGFQVILLAVAGALLLLGIETGGEAVLGISNEQRTLTVLFSAYTLVAAFIEELAFRGYLVVTKHGKAALCASIFAFSLLFTLFHPFLWDWENGTLTLHFTTKGWFSTAMVFACSLWFYILRFLPLNPSRSLLPCIAAHFTKNLGVFVVKAVGGFVSGWI